jgi:sterol desaturase/sphingolipid hydroxylase (fatty acid hydroxylase superfamily)
VIGGNFEYHPPMPEFPPFSLGSLVYTTAVLSVFIVLRYLAIAGFFYWALWKRPGNLLHARRLTDIQPKAQVVRREIYWSLVSSVIYALAGAIVIDAWRSGGTQVYMDVSEYGVLYLLLSLPLYLFLHDTWFYWTHRIMHHRKLFPVMHKVHHESRQPTPWAGFSFHPWESLVGAIILPLLVFFVPVHLGVLIILLVIMTIVGITNHAGFEIFPDKWMRGFFGRHWISATHHNLHHISYRSNFALYFRFWDRVMGTDEMEEAYAYLRTETAPDRARV